MQADMIYVMKAGNVEEFGTHSSLMQREGTYFMLWSRQLPFIH
jgi:ABC-type multidrug transport system fused ATPase/permease subunit